MLTSETDISNVVLDEEVAGRADTDMPAGLAWWLAALLVVTQRADAAVVVHDGEPTSLLFAEKFLRGAINADSQAAQAIQAGQGSPEYLLWCVAHLAAPGMLITTVDGLTSMRLHRADGTTIGGAALANLRDRLARNRVPLPVNDQARGTIHDRAQELQQAWKAAQEAEQ